MRVMTLMGGPSPEREISLMSGKAVSGALDRLGHSVTDEDFSKGTYNRILETNPDAIFLIMHGSPGEDGTVQGMLEVLGVPYTGSGVRASALSMDKAALKRFLSSSDIITPAWFQIPVVASVDIAINRLTAQGMHYPLVIKPSSAGSTIGITIIKTESELESAIVSARVVCKDVMIEEFISGKEITVSIVGNESPIILPTQQIIADSGFYDYESKYTPGMSHHVFPPDVDTVSVFRAEEMAERIYMETECRGFARADFIISEATGEPYFLELNTIPGMTEVSLVPDAAKEYGWDFDELIRQILNYALE
jgi:D-alanine-D-alanine ligase